MNPAAIVRRETAECDEDRDSHPGDGQILTLQIGLRALCDCGGDFLHPRRARVGGQEFRRRHDAIDD